MTPAIPRGTDSLEAGTRLMEMPYAAGRTMNSSRDYTRQRQMGLGDLLLENRIVFLDGPIHDSSANLIVMKLLFLQSENRHQDIHFYINSPGGSVTATMAIYDTMQFLQCPVATYCVGLGASGGAVLIAGGTKGKRFILPHAKMMIHQPYGEVGGQVSDIEIQAKEILETRDVLNQILADHTGQPIEVIAKDTDRDRYLTAGQSKEYGLVDEVLTPTKAREVAKSAV
ncbi:MAG: ATP-dependent Clp protease proteolytic subunit [Planctomycetaceae bacterium]|nr:ATP-dependent Clp protease proteolytic subunit [Planctomycetaceae bacterium]